MGQKVNPHGIRVGVIKDWDSKWYAEGLSLIHILHADALMKFSKACEIEHPAGIEVCPTTGG